jgi:hypothetical protein
MADTKISALPASTTPLAGTEVLPIVQSSSTKQVSVANLTAGRSFDALGMTLTSTDAGAAAAPILDLYRDSASPAASDTLGEIEFNGEDSAGNKQSYGLIHASILSPTSTAEQGQLHFETATAGALTEKMIIGTTNLVINEIGAVFNVRIEGDTDANLFYTDATNSRVGIGTVSPAEKLDVVGKIKLSDNLVIGTSGKGISYPVPAGGFALAPAFSAYGDAIQSLANNTATKVAYNVSVFDTNSNYSTANARFTPTVAGYYQVNCLASCSIVLTSSLQLAIYKNGAVYQNLYTDYNGGAAIASHTDFTMTGSNLVYLNGSTDYIEIYATASNGGGSTSINGYSSRPDVNYFNAVMVRAA